MDRSAAAKAAQLEREARALRANLRRRKQQAQARESAAAEPPACNPEPVALPDDGIDQ